MNAKKCAWAHVVSNGHVNKTPSFYGGLDPIKGSVCNDTNKARELIKKYGVNWTKTDDIETETYSEFAGTFAEHHPEVEYLQGWMTLNNGIRLFWVANNISSASVFSQIESLNEKSKELFGN